MVVLKVFGGALLVYAVLPTLLARVLGIGAIKKGPRGHREVFLTFDDGPDAMYTPQVLQILARHNIKAIFFVTGHNAKANPQLIKEIARAGHTIGIHGYKHKFAWLMGPQATKHDVQATSQLVYQLTGQSPTLYRPPWGVFNLVNYFFFGFSKQRTILWSFMCWDWTKNCTAQSITNIVRRRLKDGAVMILHDSAGPVGASHQAPKSVVEALPLIIDEVKAQNYQFGTPDTLQAWAQLSYIKRILIGGWQLWERCFAKLARVKPLTGHSAFRLAVRKYRGQPLHLDDGVVIQPGDLLAELHFDNALLLKITSQSSGPEQAGLTLLRHVKESLPMLAKVLSSDPSYRQIKGVAGITLINRGGNSFGFNSFELTPRIFKLLTTWYQRWLIIVFHPRGLRHLWQHRAKMVPKLLVISREQLIARYQVKS